MKFDPKKNSQILGIYSQKSTPCSKMKFYAANPYLFYPHFFPLLQFISFHFASLFFSLNENKEKKQSNEKLVSNFWAKQL